MKEKTKANKIHRKDELNEDDYLTGYPSYPPTEDIYGKYQKERNLNPEEPSKTKKFAGKSGGKNTKDFSDDVTGDDLDIPGSELDDDTEMRGDEDEENNYYSLGGDNHNDLEEDYGDDNR
jgi:hypothetical protein